MLITCGNCGNDVSDKALKCPKCKTPVKPLAVSCPECAKDVELSSLESECPHCGYPLRYLRLPASHAAKASAASPAKPASSLECPNCGLAMRQDSPGEQPECPNCGFSMRPEPEGKPRSEAKRESKAAPPKKESVPPKPKTRIRIAGERLGIILAVFIVVFGGLYLALRYDVMGMKSSLKAAAFSEETSESINGSLSELRLWTKHVISVILDQLPD